MLRPIALFVALTLPLASAWGEDGTRPPKPVMGQVTPPLQQDGPPPLPTSTAQYYVAENGAAVGPLTLDQVMAGIQAGRVTPDTMVWRAGQAEWAPAATLGDLAMAFGPPNTAQNGPVQNGPVLNGPVQNGPVQTGPTDPAQLNSFVLGTWEGTAQEEGISLTVTFVFGPDGTYTGTATARQQGVPDQTAQVGGTYTAAPIDAGRFNLSMNDRQFGPSDAVMRIIDDNTAVDETNGIQYRRTGR